MYGRRVSMRARVAGWGDLRWLVGIVFVRGEWQTDGCGICYLCGRMSVERIDLKRNI